MKLVLLVILIGLSSSFTIGGFKTILRPTPEIPKPNPTPTPQPKPAPSTPSQITYQWKNYTIGKVVVPSNDPKYGPEEVKQDILKLISLNDAFKLTGDKLSETTAAVLSAAFRYYPELPTQSICRLIISLISTESSFNPNYANVAIEESGKSYGLMQITPLGNIKQLDLFKNNHNFSGLIEFSSGAPIVVSTLKSPNDLFRPWINIHVATWIQSNLGRTGGVDPSKWGSNKQGPVDLTVKSSLGNWVAGPADEGEYNYSGSKDYISGPYFRDILNSVSDLYNKRVDEEFLENMKLLPGLKYYLKK